MKKFTIEKSIVPSKSHIVDGGLKRL